MLRTKKEYIINLKDGNAISGILMKKFGDYLEVRQAQLLTQDGSSTKLDNCVYIPKTEITFLQLGN